MKIYLEPLLKFFDDPAAGDNTHASAMIGLIGEDLNAACFAQYIDSGGTRLATILGEAPRAGMKGGKWLDRWIVVSEKASDRKTLYQCEIKNWAASAIGGRRLALDASPAEVERVATENWADQLRKSFGALKQPTGTTKVLLPMRKPVGYESLPVEPVVLYWMPVGPDASVPMFTIALDALGLPPDFAHAPFAQLSIFSVSLFVRKLLAQGIDMIDVPMPWVERRMALLAQISPSL